MTIHFYEKKYNNNLIIDKEYQKEINKYLYFENKRVWSPAKLSHICLINLDDKENYLNNILLEIENDYNDEIKLLN